MIEVKVPSQEIARYVRGLIEKGKPGDLLPSQTELSRLFRVNHLTVRKALQKLEKEGLIYRIQGKGTFIGSQILDEVKLVVWLSGRIEKNQDWALILKGMLEETEKRKINISVCSLSKTLLENKEITWQGNSWSGIFLPLPTDEELEKVIIASARIKNLMVLNRILTSAGVHYVSTDHKASAYQLTRLLIKRGHQKIGLVAYSEASYCLQRYEGFKQALQESGLTFPPLIETDGNDPEGLVRAIKEMLQSFQPTAILVLGHSYLPAVFKVVHERNLRIPQDLEIATFDEVPDPLPEKEYIHEAIQPFPEIGRVAIREMERFIRGETERVAVSLPVEIKEKR